MSYYGEPKYSIPGLNGEEKLRELILYVSRKCAVDPTFGATKLNKTLQKADFRSYALHGSPITGIEYVPLQNGPAPKRLLPVKNAMIASGELVEEERTIGGYVQRRPVALREPDFAYLTARDISIIDAVIGDLWGQPAVDVSEESHGRAWRIAKRGDSSIPYEAAFLADDAVVRPSDRVRAEQLAAQFGWSR